MAPEEQVVAQGAADSIADSAAHGDQGSAGSLPEALLKDMPMAVAVKDVDGVYRFANEAFHRAFGLGLKSIGGRRDADLYPPRVAEEFKHQDRDVVARGEARSFEQNVEVAGRKRRFLWNRFPVHNRDGKVIAIGLALVDISERIRIEAEVREACAAAEQSAAELRLALAAAETRATTDAVTGALTRRRLDEMLMRETAGHTSRMPSLLLFELDRFGDFVTRSGIGAADVVEAELLRVVRGVLPASAQEIARVWGGIFGIVLSQTPQTEAERLGLAIAARVAGSDLPHVGRAVLRFGVGEYAVGETPARWLQRVEHAMRKVGARSVGAAVEPAARDVPPELKLKPQPVRKTEPARERKPPGAAAAAENLLAQPVLLAWHQTYECGNAVIDNQHRHLFGSCNALLNAMNEGQPVKQLVILARALVDEIASHFADEETILKEAGYPAARDHARAHTVLLEKAAAMSARVAAGNASNSEMFQFLVYDVVAHHLIGTDRRYFKHLRGDGAK